ncbi:HyaD/HybD family hydrogenase maturation endopeptidase [Inmirania thermothiophila]|uniref:Hydrogenase 2 maturation peptidase n=1 Tax=Inmirania thermothiophila TaxID=1750597 RepID=A0A3N1Y5H4_9GAMM|nr:HyaD/HybD family hydrogenase maturation endopeptidase [Inmirania thermothiophila]ROR32537.1 hydrogenase 2 maturation peptidase [Inmirania thermothiophila]
MAVLVLGIGNLLLSDEGLGVHAVRALERDWVLPADVEVVDGGTAGMELLDLMAGREHVVVIDAVKAEGPPGCVLVLRDEAVGAYFRGPISPHQLGLSDVLAALALCEQTPRGLTLVGVVPASLETGLALSEPVREALPRALAEVVAELRRLGREPVHRAA